MKKKKLIKKYQKIKKENKRLNMIISSIDGCLISSEIESDSSFVNIKSSNGDRNFLIAEIKESKRIKEGRSSLSFILHLIK